MCSHCTFRGRSWPSFLGPRDSARAVTFSRGLKEIGLIARTPPGLRPGDILTAVIEEDRLAAVAARSHVMRAAEDNDVRQPGHEPFMTQGPRGILPVSVPATHPSVAKPGDLTSRDKVRTVARDVLNRGETLRLPPYS